MTENEESGDENAGRRAVSGNSEDRKRKKNSDCDRVDRTSGYFRVYDQKRPDTAS